MYTNRSIWISLLHAYAVAREITHDTALYSIDGCAYMTYIRRR
jgi:hypothetical protein